MTDANDADHPLTWTAGPYDVPTSQVGCTDPVAPCDDTQLTVNVSAATAAARRVVVRIDWPTTVYADFDLYILQGSSSVTASASTTDPEVARLAANNGVYTVHVDPYQPSGNSYTAKVYLEPLPASGVTTAGPVASYQVFAPPDNVGASGGEPSIGANWNTGAAVVGNSSAAVFVSFDDSTSPAAAKWENRPPLSNVISFDPILFTDRETGRTITSQLVSDATIFAAGCSLSSYSDDDGMTWVPSEGCGPPAGADHQSLGGGPYHASSLPLPTPAYPHAVYYCAQSVGGVLGDATCSRSDDGGLTYGPGVLVYTSECGGLHGHPRVSADGTVYLPNKDCAGATGLGQGVVVSTDNGLTWSISIVPGSTPGASDPSVAGALTEADRPASQASNTVYLGYCDGDGHAKVAVSHNQGVSWGDVNDVGTAAGIQNCVFPEMIAGDDDRAAIFFLGTPTPGAFQSKSFAGEWHGYVATTYDAGKTWGLADATPDDPVQIGCIWMQGGSNPCRNLLDFNDITLDKQGRPLFVFADGCIAPKCGPGSRSTQSRKAVNTVGRQSGCKTLFSAYDKTIGSAPCGKSAKATEMKSTDPAPLMGGALPGLLSLPLLGFAVLRRQRSNRRSSASPPAIRRS